jgi:hypothetical protein
MRYACLDHCFEEHKACLRRLGEPTKVGFVRFIGAVSTAGIKDYIVEIIFIGED